MIPYVKAFKRQTMPTYYMKVGNRKISIQESCQDCLEFERTENKCTNNYTRCFRCGSLDHSTEECIKNEICANRKGAHLAFSRVHLFQISIIAD